MVCIAQRGCVIISQMNPDPALVDEDGLMQRAGQYIQSGQLAAAQGVLESLLQRVPNKPQPRLSLAKLMLQRGQAQAATALLLETVPLLPTDDAAMACDMAQLLLMTGETVAARDCLDRAQAVRVSSGPELAALARVRDRLGQPAHALDLMDRALAAGVDSPQDHHFRGMLLQFVGRIDEAENALDTCLRRWPNFGSAALTRTRLRRQAPDTQHLDYLRQQLMQVQPDSLDHACFEFALFKELDDLGRHDEAWPGLKRANAIMHARNPYDEAGDQSLVDATIESCGTDFFTGTDDAPMFDGPVPIFVLGMPRSGTTLLDRMLSNHSKVTSAGELGSFFQQWRRMANIGGPTPEDFITGIRRSSDIDYHQLGARYLQQTQWRADGHDYYIDKMPNNVPLIGFIRRALPHARILYMARDPMAVCFSNFKAMFGDTSAHTYDMRLLGRYYQLQERLHNHWKATVSDAMLDVSYASLVEAPEDMMRRILAFCGLEFEAACVDPTRNTRPVSTPSSAQVREPIHTRGVDDWTHYEAQLEPLRRALG